MEQLMSLMSRKGKTWLKKIALGVPSPNRAVKLDVSHLLDYPTAMIVSSLQSINWFSGETLEKETPGK
jgi:hypothetical protein